MMRSVLPLTLFKKPVVLLLLNSLLTTHPILPALREEHKATGISIQCVINLIDKINWSSGYQLHLKDEDPRLKELTQLEPWSQS